MLENPGHIPPLHDPLRQAERTIGQVVAVPGAEWGMNTYDGTAGVDSVQSVGPSWKEAA